MSNNKIRVLIVDDSALIRNIFTEILNSDPDIDVVGSACEPFDAREKIKQLNPDVITLDVEMPKMDGITFLRNLMRLNPMPVVMISTLTEKGADATMAALDLGAVDFVAKPKLSKHSDLASCSAEIISKVKAAARVNLQTHIRSMEQRGRAVKSAPTITAKPKENSAISKRSSSNRVIAVGSSTGGIEALQEVFHSLTDKLPAIVVVQHIPVGFSASFVRRVNPLIQPELKEAEDGELLRDGHIYLSPGNIHLKVKRVGGQYYCQLVEGETVSSHKPSVDVLFDSVAECAGAKGLGVLLTGMGRDGADGLAKIQATGAKTLAQDEKTSVVWGMPGSAYKQGAVDELLPLPAIAKRMTELSQARSRVATAR